MILKFVTMYLSYRDILIFPRGLRYQWPTLYHIALIPLFLVRWKPNVSIYPVEHDGMPNQGILLVQHPMVLVWEGEEP